MQVGEGAEPAQPLPRRGQPGDGRRRLTGAAQPAGIGDLKLGEQQRCLQVLGVMPSVFNRRRSGNRVPGREGQIGAQRGGGVGKG